MAIPRSVALLASAFFASPILAATTSGTFNILTFNVAGLPAILQNNDVPGDKTVNTATIGTDFAKYNYSLIHVQEDFNYHATLYANDDHPYRTATSGGVPFGSGLNSLSNFPWKDFQRTKWNTCSDASSNDCLTPKGFTFMRLRVAEGVWVDAVNLHADAGTEPDDLTARASNLQQVSDFLTANSQGNPALVFGDTNSRYTRAGDIPTVFSTNNSMTDVWVELIKNGVPPTVESICENPSNTTECEIVDKVWYRGSPAVTLKATKFDYVGEDFLQEDGNVTSDHDPILVNFDWSLGQSLRVSDPFGGDGGDYYNDLASLADISGPAVSEITLRGANRLDAVSLELTSGQNFTHGGAGGSASTLTLAEGEQLTSATACQGSYNEGTRLFYLSVSTSGGQTVQAGTKTSDCTDFAAPDGWSIVGFVGRSADEVDRIGFVYGQ